MGETTFRKSIRSAVRGLWKGVLDVGDFDNTMEVTIRRNLRQAWVEGALECGISEDELSEAEQRALDAFLLNQFKFIPDFTVAIVDNRKSDNPDLTKLFNRADLWVNRYGEAKNQGKVMACQDQKLEWQIGLRGCKEHCADCLKYNGRVYRASVWNKYDIRPQHKGLSCRGFRCCCGFVVTTKPVNKGKPPAMSG